jgi:hypothetical protein
MYSGDIGPCSGNLTLPALFTAIHQKSMGSRKSRKEKTTQRAQRDCANGGIGFIPKPLAFAPWNIPAAMRLRFKSGQACDPMPPAVAWGFLLIWRPYRAIDVPPLRGY